MEQLKEVGLSIEVTGEGTDRMMTTIQLNGQFVAALSHHVQHSHKEPSKKGFWVQFLPRPELSKAQIAALKRYISEQTAVYATDLFGDQK